MTTEKIGVSRAFVCGFARGRSVARWVARMAHGAGGGRVCGVRGCACAVPRARRAATSACAGVAAWAGWVEGRGNGKQGPEAERGPEI